ncbi:MAG: aspartate aminotransferase family protein [Janthinobacterium lividum]
MSTFVQQDPEALAFLRRDAEVLLPVYARFPVVMERGEGVYLFDNAGRRYLDLMAGLGVNALGHAHPRMVQAIAEQAGQLVHLSPQYANRYPIELAERLCALSGMRGVFFSTGGSEAVEGALKLARTHARQNFGEEKREIVALRQSYHGRTYGSLSVTGQDRYRMDFGPGIPHVRFVERNQLAQLREAIGPATAAILLEPILGEGGVHVLTTEFLTEARRLADEHGALLIFDEIQSGLGRTGDWFAYTGSGVQPDMLLLGKPLGGGLPLSALLVDDDLFHSFGLAKHGSTLGGSPLTCRLGLEFLRIVEEEDLLAQVRDTGDWLQHRLTVLATGNTRAVEVRGRGLIIGMELSEPARPIAERALGRGILLNLVQGNVLRFLPSFLLNRSHVDEAIELLCELLAPPLETQPTSSERQFATTAR